MTENKRFRIITFYEFKNLGDARHLQKLKDSLKAAMVDFSIFGTIIVATEGFNATISGLPADIAAFVAVLESELETKLKYKTSYYSENPFKRAKVRLKNEIVTLKKQIEIERGNGTHVGAARWNELIGDSETLVLDTRNEYEIEYGTFENAINPRVSEFNQLPAFIEKNPGLKLDRKIAVFCTGGIRCEKFVPFLKQAGFTRVFQLEGGILKYLEEVADEENRWRGECFVFDERITVKKEDFGDPANGKKSDD